MAILERIYTIPLSAAYETVRNKRGKRAVSIIRSFALRHMKASGGVKISEGTNSAILRDGIQKPPRRIKVRIIKGNDSVAKVWLIGEEEKAKEAAEKRKKDDEAKKKKAGEEKKKPEQKQGEKKPEAPKQAEKKQEPTAPSAASAKP